MSRYSLRLRFAHFLKKMGLYNQALNLYDRIDLWNRQKTGRSFSDHGEDQFVYEYFGKKNDGFYIDVGANHPFRVSNTYMLYQKGWKGLTIEPIPYLFRRQQKFRPRDIQLNFGVSQVRGSLSFFELTPGVMSTFDATRAAELIEQQTAQLVRKYDIQVRTLADIVEQHISGKQIDLLSIDTEGHDFDVLKGIDWIALRPRLIICETHKIDLDRIDNLLQSRDYTVLKRLGYNTVYVTR